METGRRLSGAEEILRGRIVEHVKSIGLGGGVSTPMRARAAQARLRDAQARESPGMLAGGADEARLFCPDGADVDPRRIRPELRPVEPGTAGERLFRWWSRAWWSVPYQKACGRQMRFLVWDAGNGFPMGLTCLNSPILAMAARDKFLGITAASRIRWVNMSMNAHRVGALPPYNRLLGGKLAALSLISDEVREAYGAKYGGVHRTPGAPPSRLLFVVALGAFGKSAMYGRLRYGGADVARHIGYTEGFGTFHLPDAIVGDVMSVLRARGIDTRVSFERGRSQKLRLLKRGLLILGLGGLHRHGVRRAVYVFEVAGNVRDMIAGRAVEPEWPDRPFADLASFWMRRWALPRHERMPEWRDFRAGAFIDGVLAGLKA